MDVYRITTAILLLTVKFNDDLLILQFKTTYYHLINKTYQALASEHECIPRSYGLDSIVCVCNATYCDTVCGIKSLPSSEYVLYTSNQAGVRFKKSRNVFISTFNDFVKRKSIIIDPSITYQTIIGWGGAFTDAAALNIHYLNEGAKENLLRSYFSNQGIEYNLGRVPMGSSEFSTHPYSYNDGDEDEELKNFSLAPEDYKYKIPLLRQASQLTNGTLWLLASAGTAPKWMKTNDKYDGIGFLRPPMYQAWANYFLKFLQSYWEEWVDFWGITTGNQPSLIFTPNVHIYTVGWAPPQMRFWITKYLGPTLRDSDFSSIQLLAFDDQKRFLPNYVDKIFRSTKAKNYIDGIAVHSYLNEHFPITALSLTHTHHPDKFILNTGVSVANLRLHSLQNVASVSLGAWKNAESYANGIIMNVDNWVTGWMDSNIALDMAGGPTYVKNSDSAIIVNTAADEFYKQPMFYAIGHFSKFIPRSSIRIDVSNPYEGLKIVAFKKPDKGIVIVILNRKTHYISTTINDKRRGNIDITIDAKSLTTILYW